MNYTDSAESNVNGNKHYTMMSYIFFYKGYLHISIQIPFIKSSLFWTCVEVGFRLKLENIIIIHLFSAFTSSQKFYNVSRRTNNDIFLQPFSFSLVCPFILRENSSNKILCFESFFLFFLLRRFEVMEAIFTHFIKLIKW